MSKEQNNLEHSLDQSYWNTRWENNNTGWDIGSASPAIKAYMEQYVNLDAQILIPGCGNAYEAEFLLAHGFTNITLIDFAPKAVESLQLKFAPFPQVRVVCEDFFEHIGHYDLIIEQTFFCAIPISTRNNYVKKTFSLLKKDGKIVGLLFDKVFKEVGPPFGGNLAEYKALFEPYFFIQTMEKCKNSILPRKNAEAFINLIKK